VTGVRSVERLEVSVNTTAGPVVLPLEVPVQAVPVTMIVHPLRHLGMQAQALEEGKAVAQGEAVSCRKGCAACCRMLVPVSAPEAFALAEAVARWPEERRQAALARVAAAQAPLDRAGLLSSLRRIAESERQLGDEEFEPINHAYYALRLPCPFLVEEACSIYEDRPSACRELMVTSPAELCQDLERNPVRPIPVPLRIGTVLALLWAELTGGPVRFIPLPLALEWAEQHTEESRRAWNGRALLERALDKVWWYVRRDLTARQESSTELLPNAKRSPRP